jgi:phosphate starvation-inducible protein PhoH
LNDIILVNQKSQGFRHEEKCNLNKGHRMGRKAVAPVATPLSCKHVKPITINQNKAYKEFHKGYNLILHGVAGTGKTYISMHMALCAVMEIDSKYEQVIIIRSVVPTREIGYLPGTLKEKISVYEEPYREICTDLFEKATSYEELKARKKITFATTSYLRGITFKNAIIVVDEMQNLTYDELRTVITRVGDNSRLIFSGDYRQSDLERYKDRQGLHHFLKIIEGIECFAKIEFNHSDIVRNELVKEFIIRESEYKDAGNEIQI